MTSKKHHSTSDNMEPLYFYGRDKLNGYLSQMYMSKFEHEGVVYFSTEHYFQAAKARHFGQDEAFRGILAQPDPFEAKRRGRKVKIDVKEWSKVSFDVVVDANYLKFTKSEFATELQRKLLETGNRALCEASPSDSIWGIGCSQKIAHAQGHFPGQNLLGKALEEVRSMLRAEVETEEEFCQAKKQTLGG